MGGVWVVFPADLQVLVLLQEVQGLSSAVGEDLLLELLAPPHAPAQQEALVGPEQLQLVRLLQPLLPGVTHLLDSPPGFSS